MVVLDTDEDWDWWLATWQYVLDACQIEESDRVLMAFFDKAQYTVGPWVTFDPKTEKHVGEYAEQANALRKDRNRTGFEIPALEQV